jgi:hypothetical protein
MLFQNGRMYKVRQLARGHPVWGQIQDAIDRRTKPGSGPLTLEALYDIRWIMKPFPWSYTYDFKPNRRWFYHGTSHATIQRILEEGFHVRHAAHGRMLGDGVYVTYHTNKGKHYGPDGYVLSVMVYAPNTYLVGPGESLDRGQIPSICQTYDAIEVRTGAQIDTWTMQNHEICVYDIRRVIPRFILKIV